VPLFMSRSTTEGSLSTFLPFSPIHVLSHCLQQRAQMVNPPFSRPRAHSCSHTPFCLLGPPHVWNIRVQWQRDTGPTHLPSYAQPSSKTEKGDLLQVKSSRSPRLCFRDRDVDSVVIDALDHEEQAKRFEDSL